MLYSIVRFVHVATAILFLGNIVIGLFWKRRAERHGDVRTLATMLRVLAEGERRITLPAAAGLIFSGVWLARLAGIPLLGAGWLVTSMALFACSGMAFALGVAPLQVRLLAQLTTAPAADATAARPGAEYRRISFWWELWGGASILTASLALALMVFRP